MLTAALAMTVGYPARWITISTDATSPREFTHIFTEAEAPPGSDHWIALDTARFDSAFGVEPAHYFRKRAWAVASDDYEDLSGNRRPKHLSGYLSLGQGDGVNWTPIVGQTISEIPTIIAATSGQGSASSPYATYSSPYSSFATQYTPGAGIPAAGYTAPSTTIFPSAGLSLSPNTLMLLAGGILIYMLASGGGSRSRGRY